MEYEVESGDTLSSIAEKFGLKLSTVLWENGLHDESVVKGGDTLVILPVDGIRHKVADGETISSLAERYQSKTELITTFNDLENDQLPRVGEYVTVPGGIHPDPAQPPQPEPTPEPSQPTQVASAGSSVSASTSSYSTPTVQYGGGSHRFPYGWCTYWAAQKRGGVPWGGNAVAWPSNARAYGYSTGSTPVAGAIYAEPWLTGYGHVSYVEQVHANGSFTVSEMNYAGWGRVSYRTIGAGAGGTFIY